MVFAALKSLSSTPVKAKLTMVSTGATASKVAVIVAEPSSSLIVSGSTDRDTDGSGSSSSMEMFNVCDVKPGPKTPTSIVLLSSNKSLSIDVRVTEAVVSPAGIDNSVALML